MRRGALVGRDGELQRLVGGLVRLGEGVGSRVAVSGEPGIGKTSLLAALVARAGEVGRGVLIARPGPGGISFFEEGMRIDPIRAACASDVVIVVDDLHLHGSASVSMLEDLILRAGAAAVMLVLAYRPRQLSAEIAAVLAHGLSFGLDSLVVGPLDLAAARDWFGDDNAAADRIRHLHGEADGNPLYLRLLADPYGEARLAIIGDLRGLDDEALEAICMVVDSGGSCPVDLLLAEAYGNARPRAAVLDRLVAADVIRVSGQPPTATLRHQLIGQVVHEWAPSLVRMAAQARLKAASTRNGAVWTECLTRRETQIARLCSTGASSADIAHTLNLSVRTVDCHLGNVYRKLNLPGRAALTRLVLASDRNS